MKHQPRIFVGKQYQSIWSGEYVVSADLNDARPTRTGQCEQRSKVEVMREDDVSGLRSPGHDRPILRMRIAHGGPMYGGPTVADENVNPQRRQIDVDDQADHLPSGKAVESGRVSGEEEAVQQALALWEERERRRLAILAMLDEADASLARGEGIPITEESMRALAEDVKQEGRRRLAAERQRTTSR